MSTRALLAHIGRKQTAGRPVDWKISRRMEAEQLADNGRSPVANQSACICALAARASRPARRLMAAVMMSVCGWRCRKYLHESEKPKSRKCEAATRAARRASSSSRASAHLDAEALWSDSTARCWRRAAGAERSWRRSSSSSSSSSSSRLAGLNRASSQFCLPLRVAVAVAVGLGVAIAVASDAGCWLVISRQPVRLSKPVN